MSNGEKKSQDGENILHLTKEERLPAAANSSQGAELVRQIIEQILINERRRARVEFLQIGLFFLVFLFAVLGTGIWFARQLLVQLRVERQFAEQTWRMMAGGKGNGTAAPSAENWGNLLDQSVMEIPPALNREEVAKLERNIKNVSELLKNSPENLSTTVRETLRRQQNSIQALSARLSEIRSGSGAVSEKNAPVDFIAAPVGGDIDLRMPIPSL
ncbi:MAG: hypothetical protein PHP98_03790 [Kiritimatiellae bacterium]|nr:hypothetical protein [Kiritimatiellia bacterium]